MLHYESKHVVPSDHLLIRTVDVDTESNYLKFNHESNKNPKSVIAVWNIVKEISKFMIIKNINDGKEVNNIKEGIVIKVVKEGNEGKGIIIFLQSYSRLNQIETYYKNNKTIIKESIDQNVSY